MWLLEITTIWREDVVARVKSPDACDSMWNWGAGSGQKVIEDCWIVFAEDLELSNPTGGCCAEQRVGVREECQAESRSIEGARVRNLHIHNGTISIPNNILPSPLGMASR